MSLASIIAKQVVKAGGDLFKDTDIQKAISAQVDEVVTTKGLESKDGQDYLLKMTKAMLTDDPNFKPNKDLDPNLGMYLEVENKLFSGNPGMRDAYHAAKINNAKLSSEGRNVLQRSKGEPLPDDTLRPYAEVPIPATYDEMFSALTENKKQKINLDIPEGSRVGLRLDIPAYTNYDTWVPTIHLKGKSSHRATASIRDVDLMPSAKEEQKAEAVMMGGAKSPFAKISGNLINRTDAENYRLAQEALNDPSWTQVGFNPDRHSYYFDRATGDPIIAGDEAIQVGPLVLVKNAVRSEREKFRYAEGGEVIREVKGGDTLSKIAKETGVSVEDLITFNDIKDPNNIQVGQPLRLKREEGRLSAIRKEAIRQTKKTFDSFEQSISNAIPTNARAFGKFLLGNIFGSESKGEDIDVGSLGEEQQKVLKQAMINAEKKGRAYVTYDDYPTMADGQAVNDFYNQKRKDTDLIDLAKASFTDPVFEMFTSLGAFNFTKDSKGNFEVLPDKYDFDKSKSTAEDRAKPKDDYSRLTYLGQDISENKDAYGFNFKGRINVAKGGKIDKKKMACNRPKRTASHPKKSHVVKACEGGKEKIIRFGEQGAKTAGKPKAGESARMKAKRKSFKARHRRNIKRGKMSAAYWADKVKW